MSLFLRIGLTVAASAALSMALGSCTTEASSESSQADSAQPTATDSIGVDQSVTLLLDEDAYAWPDVRVVGTLGVNEFGCVTLDDRLLISPSGSTAIGSGDDVKVQVAGFPGLSVGDELDGSGITTDSAVDDLRESVPGITRCVPLGIDDVSVASIAPKIST